MVRRFNRDRTKSFSRFIWQRFVDDKCFETAGALSYTTLVSLVPLTVAMFAMFSVFPVFQPARDTLVNFVFNNFVPAGGRGGAGRPCWASPPTPASSPASASW